MNGEATFLWTDEQLPPPVPASPRPGRPDAATGRRLPAEAGLWVFVLGDMTIFGAFFAVFAWEARQTPDAFDASAAELYQPIGVLNTLILLVSSYAVVVALHHLRSHRLEAASRCLAAAMVCGLAFIVSKAVEYSLEIGAGHTPSSDTFFTFYYVMTGVHLLHVVIGLVLLAVVARHCRAARRNGDDAGHRIGFIEGSTVYWHMVDLLWIVIFGLLYLGASA